MADSENKVKLEGWSCKLTRDTKETLTELQNSGDFSTVNQMMETLIERYYSPIKSKDQTNLIQDLKQDLSQLKEKYQILRTEKSNNSDDIGNLKNQVETLNIELEDSRKENLKLENEIINVSANAELPHNGHIVIIDPLNWAILEKVAEREGNKRDQAWTPDDVINYFIHFRFEIGSLNGDLKSLPDKVIKELKETILDKAI